MKEQFSRETGENITFEEFCGLFKLMDHAADYAEAHPEVWADWYTDRYCSEVGEPEGIVQVDLYKLADRWASENEARLLPMFASEKERDILEWAYANHIAQDGPEYERE